ncbi:hypothetical protein [Naasia lichenicola]|uniref:LPXTG cell wall anchor domain-containing protein n=1 Tax=Naasia lichenicola TaxID=2565933 RepID=A0A4S4FP13_9MICO|nr:hypothetical protein [Naasia lichenicola]THG30767.1 hypothetical protein E6C64_09010 [Naasia lichenicola]THG32004.1 hypothetical protein E6C64_08155 [Naasia lichenicola]
MSLRSLPAITLVAVALLGAPAAATAVTISAVQSHSAGASTSAVDPGVSPAILAWGATGLIGLGAMVTFGATVVRRKPTRPALVEAPRDVATPTYA